MIPDTFAERLKELRIKKKLSQTELGKLVDTHYTHIGRYEKGQSKPLSKTLQKLADVLGVTTDYLLEGETKEIAKIRLEDKELLNMFQEVEELPEKDKEVIKTLIGAFLTKKKLKQLTL